MVTGRSVYARAALAHGDLGEHAVHEVRCRVGHAAATAGGAEAATLARKSHESAIATGVAANANEAMFEHAAGKVGAELALHEAGHGMLAGACERARSRNLSRKLRFIAG